MTERKKWLEATGEAETIARELTVAAKTEMGAWLGRLRPWDVFFTGTYAPKKRGSTGGRNSRPSGMPPRVSRSKALRDGRAFVAFARRLRGHRVEGVLAAEPHQDGSYHLHGLLEAPGVSDAELEGMAFYWNGRHGFSRFARPRSQEDVASYTGKYLCKTASELYLTRGLQRPQLRPGGA